MSSGLTTRLAPSPTGALHLGNVMSFALCWALARRNGWRVLMRIEDLDGPRIKSGAGHKAMELLRWLGLDWDGEEMWQSDSLAPYRDALSYLQHKGLIYPCRCTRKDIEASHASAPNHGDHELRYFGRCANSDSPPAEMPLADSLGGACSCAWRLRVADQQIEFEDGIRGHQVFSPFRQVGDFVVATKSNQPAYQLAVTVDDARQGITHIVRGCDLLASTARQILVHRALKLDSPFPLVYHTPLLCGSDGLRLAKRHGDTRLEHFRDVGVSAERVLGLLAYLLGALETAQPITLQTWVDLVPKMDLAQDNVMLQTSHEKWLLQR